MTTTLTETQTIIIFKATNSNKDVIPSLAASGMSTDARGYGAAVAGLIKKGFAEQSGVATDADYSKDGWRFRITNEGIFAFESQEDEEILDAIEELQAEADESEAEEDEEQASGSRVKEGYKAHYAQLKAAGGSGQGCADPLNQWMTANISGPYVDAVTGKTKHGVIVSQLFDLADENGISDYAKYSHLNNGMKAMNIANRLRGMARKGKHITYHGSVIVEGAVQAD
jgi:hypothetical protein